MKSPQKAIVILKSVIILLISISGCALLSGCATICGGSKYYAHVTVDRHPNATIYYNGFAEGKGFATFRVPRKDANKFAVTVQEENCDKQIFLFNERIFRGWAFVGSFLVFTAATDDGVPIPYGIFIDLLDGSLWKPEIQRGVTKVDYKNYKYVLDYDKCEAQAPEQNNIEVKSKAERLKELKELLDNGTLTKEEFEKEKKKILDN